MSAGILTTTDGMTDVINERVRQIKKEGFTSQHDDTHRRGQIAQAGAVYASVAATCIANQIRVPPCFRPKDWPWQQASFKAGHPREMLVKAAALILAEIDRLDRLDGKPATPFQAHGS